MAWVDGCEAAGNWGINPNNICFFKIPSAALRGRRRSTMHLGWGGGLSTSEQGSQEFTEVRAPSKTALLLLCWRGKWTRAVAAWLSLVLASLELGIRKCFSAQIRGWGPGFPRGIIPKVGVGKEQLHLCLNYSGLSQLHTLPLCSGRLCPHLGSAAFDEPSWASEPQAFGNWNDSLLNGEHHKESSREPGRGLIFGEVSIWQHLEASKIAASAVTLLGYQVESGRKMVISGTQAACASVSLLHELELSKMESSICNPLNSISGGDKQTWKD